jgi:adenylylsulfate kinase-like enzyme
MARRPARAGPVPPDFRRRGELKNCTGIDSRYEAPEHPELQLRTAATAA